MRKLTSRLAAAALVLFAAAAPARAQSANLGAVPIVPGPIGNKPVAIAIDESNGFAYTANKDSNTLCKINLSSNAVVGVISMPAGSCIDDIEMVISVVSGAHKHLWVHRADNNLSVYEIDPSLTFAQITGTGSLALPSAASDIAVDDSVCRVFLCCPSSAQIAVFQDSPSHGAFIAPTGFSPVALPGGSSPTRLALADAPGLANRLFIAERTTAGFIRTMNTSTGSLGSIAFSLPNSPPHFIWDVSFNGGAASATAAVLASARSGMGDGVVSFDLSSTTAVQMNSLSLSGAIGTNKIEEILAYSTNASDSTSRVLVTRLANFGVDGGVAVIATMASSTSTILNTRTFPVTVKLGVSGSGTAQGGTRFLAADPLRERFYALHEDPCHLHVFDGVSGGESGDPSPSVFEQSGAVAVNRTAAKLMLTQIHNNFVAVYSSTASPTTPVTPTAIIPLPAGLNGISVDSSVNKILLTTPGISQYIMDGVTHAVTTVNLPVAAGLGEAYSGTKAGLAYLAGGITNTFYAVNLTTNAVTSIAIPAVAGESIQGIAFDPTADRLYVGAANSTAPSSGSGDLFVIDTNPSSGTFNTVVSTFVIGSATTPCDFRSMTVDRTNGVVYALDAFGGGNPAVSRVFRIQGSTGAVLGTAVISRSDIDHGPEVIGVNPSSSPVKVYVGVSANVTPTPFVRILNGSDLSLIADVTVGFTHLHFDSHGGNFFTIDESTGRVYFAVSPSSPDPADPKVLTINSANAFETALGVGPVSPCGDSDVNLAFNSAIGRLYAISDENADLFRFDGVTPVTSPALSLTTLNGGLGVNLATGRVYGAHGSTIDVFGNPVSVGTLTTVSGSNMPAAGTFAKGQASVALAQITLSADSAEAINLQTFIVGVDASNTTINPVTGVSAVRLYHDADNNGLLGSGDVQLGSTTSYPASGTATFSGSPLLSIPASATRNLLVVQDFTTSVGLGQTFTVLIASPTSDTLGAVSGQPVSHLGSFPIYSSVFTVGARTSWMASLPGGTTEAAYRMIGVPLNTGGTTSSQLESNVLGGNVYDKTQMRFFVWDSSTQAYIEHGETGYFDPESSCGFWVILRNARSVTWTGTSTAGSSFFSDTLDPGWNLVHNPFDEPVSMANIGVSGSPGSFTLNSASNTITTQGGFFWNGSGYTFETGAAIPGQAYWIQNLTSSSASIFLSRPTNATKAGSARAVSRASAAPPGVAPPPPPSAAPTTGGGSSGGGGGGGGCFLSGAGIGSTALPFAPYALAGMAAMVAAAFRRRIR